MYRIYNIKYWNGWYDNIGGGFGNDMRLIVWANVSLTLGTNRTEHMRMAEITMMALTYYELGGAGKRISKCCICRHTVM